MKKSLLALAVLGSFAGIASAQTNVTIYGVADIGLERTDLSPGAATTSMTSGIQSGSRIGFKGNEDLGGGMSVSFQLENGFGLDTGAMGSTGVLFNRQAWLGLNGGFGSVKFGRQYNQLFNGLDTIDPFGTGITGDGSGIVAVFRHYGLRTNNAVTYTTPTMGGLSGEVSYGLREGGTSSQFGTGLTYANGPVTGVFGYHKVNGTGAVDDQRTFMFGGVYDLRAVKVHAAFADNRDETTAGAASARSRDLMVGVSAPVGAGEILASYVRHDDRLAGGTTDADFWQLGYTHNLSKRTNLYTSYSALKNDAAGAVDTTWINVGIRHKF